MHTETLPGYHNGCRRQRGWFSALRRRRRNWRRNRRQANFARRLGLTYSQQDRLAALRQAGEASRERLRAGTAELLPRLDEVLQQGDAGSETIADILRESLRTLDTEVDADNVVLRVRT